MKRIRDIWVRRELGDGPGKLVQYGARYVMAHTMSEEMMAECKDSRHILKEALRNLIARVEDDIRNLDEMEW